MTIEMAKGVRDFAPEDKILREELISTLTTIFQEFGFSPLETPSIERLDTLTAKFAAGEGTDTSNEIFKLTDQGNRELGLRFDLTVPLSRFIALNPTIKLPFKRYEIGRVFRDGPIKLGRYREFWQCDVDIIGVSNVKAESELLLIVNEVFKQLQLDGYIEINHRQILFGIMNYCGISAQKRDTVIISIDKLAKYGTAVVRKELEEKELGETAINKLLDVFTLKGTNFEILEKLEQFNDAELNEGIARIRELLQYLKFVEHDKIVLNIALARGLNYYTGTVFEGFLRNSKITSSICGGGRYDNMIGMFANNGRQYPAVGLAFGLEPITDALTLQGVEKKKTVTELFIVPIKTFQASLEITNALRRSGINVEIDLMDRGISKNMDYANTQGIPFVAFIGDAELEEKKIKIKHMKTGEEQFVAWEDVAKIIDKARTNKNNN